MIDIHCHILPGVDDGAQTLEMSVAMARAFEADGVRTVVATSHFCYVHRVDRAVVHRKLEDVREELDRQGVTLTLLPGNEVRLESSKFFYEAAEADAFCYLGGDKRFLLVEQPWEGFNPDTHSIIKDLLAQGTRPILAHPERQLFFRASFDLLERQLALGCWTQVNVGSLLGENGPDAQAFAFDLVDRGLAHTIATDAHNLKRRPNLSLGFQAIEARAGAAAAEAIRARMATIAP
ncbi:MAG TPA: CpsB/CapC family capsule biosynthesis tyrosine phosphatase [Paenibacillus sp.]|nr:CpsB/CapC family capsule biosynthesis tyrosine phosphatase [Paenibacillus sp.]